MKDITHPGWIKAKGILFLLLGMAAAVLLWLEHPTGKVALLLALTVWGFCRAYYCAFYVIEHYVDPTCKFSGLGSFVRFLIQRRRDQ